MTKVKIKKIREPEGSNFWVLNNEDIAKEVIQLNIHIYFFEKITFKENVQLIFHFLF